MNILDYTKHTDEEISNNGIYLIYHIDKPNTYYIGSCFRNAKYKSTKGFRRRWFEHFNYLKNKNHASLHLQRTINKLGLEGIRFEILEIINDKSILIEREEYWINYYHKNHKIYNFSLKANPLSIITKLPKVREKRSRAMKGRFIGELHPYSKRVFQYSLSGEFIKEYSCIKDASKHTKILLSLISKNCNYSQKQAGGFLFRFKKLSEDEINKLKENPIIIKNTRKPVLQYDKEDNFIKEWLSIKEISNTLNYSKSTISLCLTGKYKYGYGYKWKYK